MTMPDGRYYIATLFSYNVGQAATLDDPGEPEWHGRRVIRRWATSEAEFRREILEEYCNDEDMLGPVSIAKNQER